MARLLREYVRAILLEGQFEKRLQQVSSQEKFEPYREHVDQFQQALIQNEIKNVGYLNWGLKQILRARDAEMNTIVDEIVSLLKHFDHLRKGLEKKDINQYGELGELRGAIEDRLRKKSERDRRSSKMSDVAKKAEAHLQKAIRESDLLLGQKAIVDLINTEIIVAHPRTTFASQFWGNPHEFACDINVAQGSVKWCTSAMRSDNYFASYSSRNVHLYYIIDKRKDPSDRFYKIAYALVDSDEGDIEIFDATDESIGEGDVRSTLGEGTYKNVRRLIQRHFEKSEGTEQHKKIKLAQDPGTSPAILQKLASDEERHVRRKVARNSSTPLEILQKLASDEERHVRIGVAENPNIPLEILQKLASDEDPFVRRKVAENPSAPLEILQKLASDEDFFARRWVAENPSAPASALQKLASDEDPFVRKRVAENPSAPASALQKLASDEERHVRIGVAENPSTPASVLRKLANDESKIVRKRVAENPSAPLEILQKFASDESSNVRVAVAKNPSTPASVLRKLANDESKNVRKRVAENSNIPLEILQKLASDESSNVRVGVVRNPNIPLEILQKLASDESSNVRVAVPKNPSTPLEILQKLASDENYFVRLASRSRLQEL